MSNASSIVLVGWKNEGDTRGTWDIITSSLFTIIACTWTVLHPRIHVDRTLRRLHKVCQLSKQILAPELETIEALQEYVQARKAKACCSKKTKDELSLTQSFYIGMMGVRYETGIPGGYRVLWPLQYAFLLNENIISWPPDERWGLSEELIEDKSKADGLLKLFTLLQVAWFTVNCIVRSVHHMELAPLESMTLAYVVQVFLTYICWWKKPKDIATASFVQLPDMEPEDRSVFNSLAMELTYDVPDPNTTKQSKSIAWYIIPRDCGESDYKIAIEKAKSLYKGTSTSAQRVDPAATHKYDDVHASPKSPGAIVTTLEIKRARPLVDVELGMPGVKHGGSGKNQTQVITEWDDSLYWTKWWPILCLVGCSFGAVHMISWNGQFPTEIELWLWRASCIGSIVFALITMQFKKVEFRWRGIQTIVQIGSPIMYVLCRLFMVAEVIAAFRAMPKSTYLTYNVVNYWLHLL